MMESVVTSRVQTNKQCPVADGPDPHSQLSLRLPRRAYSMSTALVLFHFQVVMALTFSVIAAQSAYAETVNVSRRLVRFDGKPAAGARVRVLTGYACPERQPEAQAVADTNGVFSVDREQSNSAWWGYIIVRAEGCAATCQIAVSGRRKTEPWTPVLRLGRPFLIEGRTLDSQGHPIAGATVSLVSAHFKHWNPIAFNSTTFYPIATPEGVAHSASNGVWSMPGIDFVDYNNPIAASAIFEAVSDEPLWTSRLTLQLDPDPGTGMRTNVSVDLGLAPSIRVTGSVVDSVTGDPVTGAGIHRNVLFTTISGSRGLTDHTGRFELQIPEALTVLYFDVYREGFARVTAATETREHPTRDWGGTQDLRIRLRPMVEVSGMLRDNRGKPPDEPVELFATFEDLIEPDWKCNGTDGEAKVAADGSFNGKLPTGQIMLALRGPPQQMGSGFGPGLPPQSVQLQQEVDVPAEGKKDWQLTAARRDESK